MKERLTNNLGLKILAFIIAVLLWFIVVNIDNPIKQEVYNDIPVNVINTEVLSQEQQTFQILDDTQTVAVTITAQRSVLQKINPSDIVAIADMKELTLKTQIPIDITVNGHKVESAVASPRNLQIKLEEEMSKKFPIVPTTTGTVRDGFALGDIKAVPEKVSLRGPKSVIERISRVEAAVSVSGLSQDQVLDSELKLYDKNNEEIDQKLLTNNIGMKGVGVSVQILHTKNVSLSFDTSEIRALKGYGFKGITYQPMEIAVAGKKDVLSTLNEIKVPSSALAMSGLTDRVEKVVDISGYLPREIKLVDENAGSVVVTIEVEKNGTKTYDVTVASIVVENLAADLQLNYSTVDAVVLKLRGPDYVLESFNPNSNIRIDLKEYKKAGTYIVPVQVEYPESCTLESDVTVAINLVKTK